MEIAGQEQETLRERGLVERARRGEMDAFDALVQQYETLAFRVAYLILHDPHEAADAAQEAFVRAYRALGSFRMDDAFRPWLLRIVTNQAVNHIRASKRRERLTERYAQMVQESSSPPSPQQSLEARDQNERLLGAVSRLKPDEQILISLRYFLELPESQVAQVLAIPTGTVKSRTHRTLAKLRQIIQKEFPDLMDLC